VLADMRLEAASSGTGQHDLQIRRVPLGVAGFLACADFRHFAWPDSAARISQACHWQIDWRLAAHRDDTPGPSGRLSDPRTGGGSARSVTAYRLSPEQMR
jgi:hypothetical protein